MKRAYFNNVEQVNKFVERYKKRTGTYPQIYGRIINGVKQFEIWY